MFLNKLRWKKQVIFNEIETSLAMFMAWYPTYLRTIFVFVAIGCANLEPPANARVDRYDDSLVVRCNLSQETWYLTCKGTDWIGTISNCSDGIIDSAVLFSCLSNCEFTKRRVSFFFICKLMTSCRATRQKLHRLHVLDVVKTGCVLICVWRVWHLFVFLLIQMLLI